ncbi:MAG: yraD [Herbinix sp.]|jgi:similar to spore coat protein|nr:yraD [Herbinix sp.]
MNSFIEKLTGMDKMTDQVIATDFLISAKSAVKSYSIALTETTSPEVRTVLRTQLGDALASLDSISNYMIDKGYNDVYDLNQQFKVDIQTTETALKLV